MNNVKVSDFVAVTLASLWKNFYDTLIEKSFPSNYFLVFDFLTKNIYHQSLDLWHQEVLSLTLLYVSTLVKSCCGTMLRSKEIRHVIFIVKSKGCKGIWKYIIYLTLWSQNIIISWKFASIREFHSTFCWSCLCTSGSSWRAIGECQNVVAAKRGLKMKHWEEGKDAQVIWLFCSVGSSNSARETLAVAHEYYFKIMKRSTSCRVLLGPSFPCFSNAPASPPTPSSLAQFASPFLQFFFSWSNHCTDASRGENYFDCSLTPLG